MVIIKGSVADLRNWCLAPLEQSFRLIEIKTLLRGRNQIQQVATCGHIQTYLDNLVQRGSAGMAV